MEREKWIWLFAIFAVLSIVVFVVTMYIDLGIEILYVNIIRGILGVLALIALAMAFLTKK
jgi:hypothetical protein